MDWEYGFFNSLNSDRTYDASDFRKFTNVIVNDGLSVTTSDEDTFKVSAESTPSMNLNIAQGAAVIKGAWIRTTETNSVSIATAPTTYARYDAVVLEFNSTTAERSMSFGVVQGTASSSPVYPTLTQTDTVYQVALAYVRVGRNVTSIDDSKIVDARGTDDCPWMSTAEVENLKETWKASTTSLGGVIIGAGLGLDSEGKLKVLGGEGGYGTFNYDELSNHPTVNGVELMGDLSTSDLRLDFEGKTTTFNDDGSITATYANCKIVTIFNDDGSITDNLTDLEDVILLTKTTVFNDDGSITETITE